MKDWKNKSLAELVRAFHDATQILEEKFGNDLSKVDKWSTEFTNSLFAYSDICCALGDLFNVDPKEIAFG